MKKVRLIKASLGRELKNQVPYVDNTASPNFDEGDIGSDKPIDVNSSLSAVPRKEANLEAEKGETAVTDLNNDGLPEFYKINGKPHSKGGTPLNLPENSFIYSKDKKLHVKDPGLLKQFGKKVNKSKKKYTPAEISMQYDINNYRKILADPNSDSLQISTAELMIKNYMDKLGALALVQESIKGFENGIPKIAEPYLEKIGVTSDDIVPPPPPPPEQAMPPQGMAPQEMPPQDMASAGPPPMDAPMPNEAPPEVVPVPAKYGLETFDEGGEAALTKFNPGGENTESETKSSTRPTGKQNIPKDATLWDVDAEGYDPSAVNVGDYVKHDGRWYRQTKKVYTAYDGPDINTLDASLNGAYGDMREPYGRLVQKFNTDQDVRTSFLTNFRKEIDGLVAGQGNVKQADIDKLKALDDQGAIDYFLNGNKHHMQIAAQMGDVKDVQNVGKWDEGRKDANGVPLNYKAAIGKVGLDPLSTDQTLGMQSGFIAMQKMYDDPEIANKLKNFQLPKTGVGDEGAAGYDNISKADGWEGNTTAGEMVLWKPTDYKLEEEEADWLKAATVKEDAVRAVQKPKTPYWTQDKLNVGNALIDQFGIKKRNPWTAMPNLTLPDPTFADFRGAAGRLGSQAQAGAQQLSTFGTPQAFNAGFANIQRNNVKGITALQDQEYKTNVATSNQFKNNRAQMLNQHSANTAALKTKQFDKQTIADQQYDNAKKAARWNTVGMINNALTNRGKTQNMNANTDSFYIDPRPGYKHFYEGDPYGKDISPTTAPKGGSDATYEKAKSIMKDGLPGMTWDNAIKIANSNKSTTKTQTPGYYPQGTVNRRRRGYNQGYNQGYPYDQGYMGIPNNQPFNQGPNFNGAPRRRVKYGGTISNKRKCKVTLPK